MRVVLASRDGEPVSPDRATDLLRERRRAPGETEQRFCERVRSESPEADWLIFYGGANDC